MQAPDVKTIVETLDIVRGLPWKRRVVMEDRLLERMLEAPYPECESQHN